MNLKKAIISISLMLCWLAVQACGSAADPTYQGERLAFVTGNIVSQMTQPPDDCDVILAWEVSASSPDYAVYQRVNVTGGFPASFLIDICEPPAEEALNDLTQDGQHPDESRIGVAHIAVVKTGATLDDEENMTEVVLGGAEDQMLVYVESDIQPGTYSERLLGGCHPAGFYIVDVGRLTQAEKEQKIVNDCGCTIHDPGTENMYYTDCVEPEPPTCDWKAIWFDSLVPSAEGMDTSVNVRLVDDIEELDWANWT
jgi:hypothetical protein